MASLKEELANSLPQGFECRIRYVRSQPKACDPLFSASGNQAAEKTRLSSHFLTVSIDQSPPVENGSVDTLVLGIEVLVYSTKYLTTMFVSKADSTGYLPQQRPSPSRSIITTFLRWLSSNERQRHPSRTLVISLFARAQSQYLFPGSADNSSKHVLDDRQLIKWWARVLDPIFPAESSADTDSLYDGYITVPGYERGELRQFMPPSNNKSGARARWKPGNPLPELARIRRAPIDAPPRTLLPVFPDDPKARFIQDLDGEVGISDDNTVSPSKRHSGKWSTIRDLDRFWEAMEFRQECSSGRMVGFIWLVMRSAEPLQDQPATQHESQDSLPASQDDVSSQRDSVEADAKNPAKRRRKPLSGPIVPRQPRLKGGSSSHTASSDLAGMLDTNVGNGIVLSKDGYDKAIQTLLHLDFASAKTAAASTEKWVSAVSAIAGLQADWSIHVRGTVHLMSSVAGNTGSGAVVNDLGGMIRKKRKNTDDTASQVDVNVADAPAVNTLSSSMIRKKPKAT